jgi:Mor family transcriptional regulator
MMDQEKNEELRSLGMDRLKKLLGESERLRKMSGQTENPPSNKQMREWVKILKETSQILEQELERRSTEEMKTER